MATYRIRVEADALEHPATSAGRATTRLGGGVVSVDLREIDGQRAVDEAVVELPQDLGGAALRSELRREPSTELLSCRSCAPTDLHDRTRRWVEAVTASATDAGSIRNRLQRACPLATVIVAAPSSVDASMVRAPAGDELAEVSVVTRTSRLPAPIASSRGPVAGWLLALPQGPSGVALLVRPTSLRFTAEEVARAKLLLAT